MVTVRRRVSAYLTRSQMTLQWLRLKTLQWLRLVIPRGTTLGLQHLHSIRSWYDVLVIDDAPCLITCNTATDSSRSLAFLSSHAITTIALLPFELSRLTSRPSRAPRALDLSEYDIIFRYFFTCREPVSLLSMFSLYIHTIHTYVLHVVGVLRIQLCAVPCIEYLAQCLREDVCCL